GERLVRLGGPAGRAAFRLRLLRGRGFEVVAAEEPDQDAAGAVIPGYPRDDHEGVAVRGRGGATLLGAAPVGSAALVAAPGRGRGRAGLARAGAASGLGCPLATGPLGRAGSLPLRARPSRLLRDRIGGAARR